MARDIARVLTIPAMSDEEIATVCRFEEANLAEEQIPLFVDHLIHGRVYYRTIFIPAGVKMTGGLIKIATAFTISGHALVYTGGRAIKLRGYHVIPASPRRKQAVIAISDTYITMSFATRAKTVKKAEREFTDDADRLASRRDNMNAVLITGE